MPTCTRCRRGYVVWPVVFVFGFVAGVLLLLVLLSQFSTGTSSAPTVSLLTDETDASVEGTKWWWMERAGTWARISLFEQERFNRVCADATMTPDILASWRRTMDNDQSLRAHMGAVLNGQTWEERMRDRIAWWAQRPEWRDACREAIKMIGPKLP